MLPEAGQGWVAHQGRIYVAGGHASAVFAVNGDLSGFEVLVISRPGGEVPSSFVADVALTPSGEQVLAVEQHQDTIAVLERASGRLLRRFAAGKRPARVLVDGARAIVASGGDDRILELDLATGRVLRQVPSASQPADLLLFRVGLYVAGAGSNIVDLFEAASFTAKQRLNLAFAPRLPYQKTPSHLSLDAERNLLFVTCSDAKVVAVVSLRAPRSEIVGYIPTGWYPTSSLALPGNRLLVLNCKGVGSASNPRGPNPAVHRTMTPLPPSEIEYIPLVRTGSASLVRWNAETAPRLSHAALNLRPRPTPPSLTGSAVGRRSGM